MDFIKIKNNNNYQLTQIRNFLQDLEQNTPDITIFSDDYFRSVASIPFVEIQKEHKSLVAKVFFQRWRSKRWGLNLYNRSTNQSNIFL